MAGSLDLALGYTRGGRESALVLGSGGGRGTLARLASIWVFAPDALRPYGAPIDRITRAGGRVMSFGDVPWLHYYPGKVPYSVESVTWKLTSQFWLAKRVNSS